jgi:hypothetical protein
VVVHKYTSYWIVIYLQILRPWPVSNEVVHGSLEASGTQTTLSRLKRSVPLGSTH